MDKGRQDWGFGTRAIRTGYQRTPEGEHGEAIFTTSSYVFNSAEQGAARFGGEEEGNIYSRFTNPTVRTFEERLASLEGGERGVAFGSGMSAIMATCMGLLKAGDHIVVSRSIFGTTVVMLNSFFAKFGVDITYVSLTEMDQWEAAMKPNTRLLFLETPANPLTQIGDLSALAELAHQNNALLVVDNTVCTPALQQPLKFGADVSIHSATKYIDGQGRGVGGAVIGSGQEILDIYAVLRSGGPTMSPFNAWMFLKGLETLKLRMGAHTQGATELARWLTEQKGVTQVFHPSLDSHPQKALAEKQQSGAGGFLSFEVEGGREGAWKLINATQMLSITANLGDTRTTITHPATTTHGRLTPEEKQEAGITEGLIRVAVGLEDLDDIKADLARGL